MKRQSEEVFFKYNTIPTQSDNQTNSININLPSNYSPIAGDIVELFISENQNTGYLTYYAKLLFYKPLNTNKLYDVAAINGRLAATENNFAELESAEINEKNGVFFFTLNTPFGTAIDFDPSGTHIVNLIVHRSKASIDLYYL